ncbi:hypothetical protein ACWZJV_16565 [Nocardioides sp. WG-D5]
MEVPISPEFRAVACVAGGHRDERKFVRSVMGERIFVHLAAGGYRGGDALEGSSAWFVAGNRGGVSARRFDVPVVEPLAPGSHLLVIHGGDGHGWTTSVQAEITVC